MPLFDYRCKTCEQKFEVLIFSTQKSPVKCEKCGSEKTEKLISSFAANNTANNKSDNIGASCNTNGGFT